MSSTPDGSVTRWIHALKEGDRDEAAERLWGRYFDRLVGLARRKLQGRRLAGACEDEEDAALSAFVSLCEGAAAGRFDRLTDREDLWKLLVVITARKALDQRERLGARKRGGGRVVDEAALAGAAADGDGLDQIIGLEPTPEFAAMLAEEYRRRLHSLGDETLRQVAIWRMEGYGNDEIAARLGCVARSVGRKLDLIRKTWQAEDDR